MKYLGKDFKEAIKWLADENNIIISSLRVQGVQEVQGKPFDASRYERFFARPFLNKEAKAFLFDERRLDERVVRWCRLTSWKDMQGVPWLQTPYYDREGKLIGVQNRNLAPSILPPPGEAFIPAQTKLITSPRKKSSSPEGGRWEGASAPRFRFPRGSKCSIYGLPVLNRLKPGETLYIAEGCSDCWSLLSAGHKAIAIPSATLLSRKDAEQLSTLNSQFSIQFEMYPDRDVPGERLFLQLREVLPNLVRHQLPPDCKDFSEYYLKLTIEN